VHNPSTGIGIDVGGTKIWALLGTEDGCILAEKRLNTEKTLEGFVRQMDDIIGDFTDISMQKTGLRPCGIGIGLPGRVSSTTIDWVPNLPELNGLNLADLVEQKWNLPVRLQNDGQLALLGEQWLGAAKGVRSAVLLTLGTGIGGGIMINGELWRGVTGTAGAMGWVTLDETDEGDPERGWLERKISGTAVNQRASKLSVPLDSRQLFEAARAGNKEAVELVQDIGHCLGTAIANLASVLDPELVVIGGGLSLELDGLMPYVKEAVSRFGSPTARQVRIVPARLLDKAGGLGALRLSFG